MPSYSQRHFLQIPGPTNLPERVLRAIDRPTIDHRGTEFAAMAKELLARLKAVFQTRGHVVVYPASGTGAWEASLVNTLSPGEKVLMAETGHFAVLWAELAENLGVAVDLIPGDWRRGVSAEDVHERLTRDSRREIKAVAVVHNETSTGVTSDVAAVRRAMDQAGHEALLLVDTISSLASIDYRHDEWGVDVTIAGSQKGLMLPPGLSFNAVSDRALDANRRARLPRAYWDWGAMVRANADGFFPYTPATNLLFGLREAVAMLEEEGLDNVFARHERLAEATRRAARAWGLELQCQLPSEYSHSLTALRTPEGADADAVRQLILEHFDMSLGAGLGRLAGRVFRIGHLGMINDLMLVGALAGVQMGLELARVPLEGDGVAAAMGFLREAAGPVSGLRAGDALG